MTDRFAFEEGAGLGSTPMGWPEQAMVGVESRLSHHVRTAARAYAIAVLYELRNEVLTDDDTQPELREAFGAVLEAKATQLRQYNRIDYRQQPEPREPS